MNYQKPFLIVNVILLLLTGSVFAQPYRCPDLSTDDSINFAVFANNWQKSSASLAGDFDNNSSVDINDLEYLADYRLDDYECKSADFNLDYSINFVDFAKLADVWLSDSGDTGWDDKYDLDCSESIDFDDLKLLSDRRLETYPEPNETFDALKDALAAGDIETALTFMADNSKDKYDEIFQAIDSNLPDFAAGMGTLTLESQEEGRAVYEMTHQDGSITYSFPVVFIKDDDGNWKIYNF